MQKQWDFTFTYFDSPQGSGRIQAFWCGSLSWAFETWMKRISCWVFLNIRPNDLGQFFCFCFVLSIQACWTDKTTNKQMSWVVQSDVGSTISSNKQIFQQLESIQLYNSKNSDEAQKVLGKAKLVFSYPFHWPWFIYSSQGTFILS